MRDDLRAATATLTRAGVETPRADAEWLLAGLLGVGRAALALRLETSLEPETARRYAAAVRRRARREPLQRILGWEGFRGLRLRVTGDVLVPRPETEILVEWSLALVPSVRVAIDVGTGSGCIACSIATERPAARVIAVDSSPAAAAVARANVDALGLGDRVAVVVTDLLAGVGGPGVDLIVANLPYIPSSVIQDGLGRAYLAGFQAALDGGADGLLPIRRLIASAPGRLTTGGALVLETAGGTQTPAVMELMRTAGFTGVATRQDLLGVERFVAGRWS